MEKIATEKVAAVLSTVPGMLRSLSKERDGLLEKNSSLQSQVDDFEQMKRVDTLAKTAADKHIESLGETHEDKVASIEQALEDGKSLDVMEEAVKLSSPHGEIAKLAGDEIEGGEAGHELMTYLQEQL
jgi:hypothetical protein